MSQTPSNNSDSTVIWLFDRAIASDPNNCAPVIEELLDHLETFDWGNKDTFGIHMAMEEAIMNAICHGNERCEQKRVEIVIRLDSDQFYARISDQGCGFDPKDVPDPTEDENLSNTTGRGVALIRHFVDDVIYNNVGNSVELKKAKTGR